MTAILREMRCEFSECRITQSVSKLQAPERCSVMGTRKERNRKRTGGAPSVETESPIPSLHEIKLALEQIDVTDDVNPVVEYVSRLYDDVTKAERWPARMRHVTLLSRGDLATVSLVNVDGTLFCLKTQDIDDSEQEIRALRLCDSHFVSRVVTSLLVGSERWLFLEYHAFGDLETFLRREVPRGSMHFKAHQKTSTQRARCPCCRFCLDESLGSWLVACLLQALTFLHGQGVLHLDLKPANILLSGSGFPVLTDFGSAHVTGSMAARVSMTTAYSSPELLRGEGVDCWSDVWSLGVVTFLLLSGCLPFEARDTLETELLILSQDFRPRLDHVTSEAAEFILICLRKSKVNLTNSTRNSVLLHNHVWLSHLDFSQLFLEASPLLPLMKCREKSEPLELCLMDLSGEEDEFDTIPLVSRRPWGHDSNCLDK